jgi:hypothetical protein
MQTFVHADVVANLPARWTGSFRAVGGGVDVPQWFILKQDSAKLTGTGGPGFTEQYPIIHGLVAGDSVKFELNNRRKTFLYDLCGGSVCSDRFFGLLSGKIVQLVVVVAVGM